MPSGELDDFQRRLGYRFRRASLLVEALTHKSYLNEARRPDGPDNERLEFLGDAVLTLVVSEHLVAAFPDATEGELSKLRSRLVSEEALASVARRIELGDVLRLGRGETLTHGRDKPSILGDALEAVLDGVFLDGGLNAAAECVTSIFREELASCDRALSAKVDFKTDLQEFCQREFEVLPHYRTIRETGPDHEKLYEVELLIRGDRYGVGVGRSKKEAEQMAAKRALEHLVQDKEGSCDTSAE